MIDLITYILSKNYTNKVASGKADLVNGKVPSEQLPSYVDDVIEGYYYNGAFYSDSTHTDELEPEQQKIYVDIPTDRTYRWSGSQYIQIGCQDLSAILSNFASLYDATSTYEEGDLVTYIDTLYLCVQAITTPEEFNANHWTVVNVDELLAQKQDTLVSGTNIKTIQGETVLGSGDIEIPTYSPFKSTWRNDTVAHLLEDIDNDITATEGKSYLGEVLHVTASEGLFNGNAEIFVNVMRQISTTNKVIWCVISSNNVDPYHWEATFSNGSISAKGWTPYVPGTRTIAGIDLKDNITTAELQTALSDTTHRFVTDDEKTAWNNPRKTAIYSIDSDLYTTVYTGSNVTVEEGSLSSYSNCTFIISDDLDEPVRVEAIGWSVYLEDLPYLGQQISSGKMLATIIYNSNNIRYRGLLNDFRKTSSGFEIVATLQNYDGDLYSFKTLCGYSHQESPYVYPIENTLTELGSSSGVGQQLVHINLSDVDIQSTHDNPTIGDADFWVTKERWDNFVALASSEFGIEVTLDNIDTIMQDADTETHLLFVGYLMMDYYNGKILPESYLTHLESSINIKNPLSQLMTTTAVYNVETVLCSIYASYSLTNMDKNDYFVSGSSVTATLETFYGGEASSTGETLYTITVEDSSEHKAIVPITKTTLDKYIIEMNQVGSAASQAQSLPWTDLTDMDSIVALFDDMKDTQLSYFCDLGMNLLVKYAYESGQNPVIGDDGGKFTIELITSYDLQNGSLGAIISQFEIEGLDTIYWFKSNITGGATPAITIDQDATMTYTQEQIASGGSGADVEANPEIPTGASITHLKTLRIGDEYYSVEGGSGSSTVSLIEYENCIELDANDLDIAGATETSVDLTSSGQNKVLSFFQKARELNEEDKLGAIQMVYGIEDFNLRINTSSTYVSGSQSASIYENFQCSTEDGIMYLAVDRIVTSSASLMSQLIDPISLGYPLSVRLMFYKKEIEVPSGGSGIPTVTIDASQVVGVDPLDVQLTNDQYDMFANNKQVMVDMTALDPTYPIVVWQYTGETSGEIYFGFNDAGQGLSYYRITIDKSTYMATYEYGAREIAPSQIYTGGGADEGKLLAMDSNGEGTLTNNLPILTSAPAQDNTEGGIIIVVLSQEPATYYNGYYYIITSA